MAQQDVDALKRLRARMVEQRRALAARDADLGYSDTRTHRLVALQTSIEAVDRAIVDEEEITRSQREQHDGEIMEMVDSRNDGLPRQDRAARPV